MPLFLFLILAAVAIVGGLVMILHRNPVISALALAVSFLAVAGLYIQLDAELMGIFQILVYAGAIMVLFLFIIMLLDIKGESRSESSQLARLGAALLAALFLLQLTVVLISFKPGQQPLLPLDPSHARALRQGEASTTAATDLPTTTDLLAIQNELPDAHLLGEALFGRYLLPLQLIAVLLLVASVGVVVLSKRQSDASPAEPGEVEAEPPAASKASAP